MIHEAINLLIGQDYRVFCGKVTQGTQLPYVNHFQVSMNPTFSKDNKNELKVIRYQISVFAKTKAESISISDQIVLNLQGVTGNIKGHHIESIRNMDENDLYEDDAEVYHRVIDFEIRYK